MNPLLILGYVAGILGTLCYLPQVIKIWRTKKTRDLSRGMYITICTSQILWIIYGVELHAAPIYITNTAAFCLTLSILVLKFIDG